MVLLIRVANTHKTKLILCNLGPLHIMVDMLIFFFFLGGRAKEKKIGYRMRRKFDGMKGEAEWNGQHACMHMCVCVHACVCVCVCMCVCVIVHACVQCMHACMQCMHVCVCLQLCFVFAAVCVCGCVSERESE